jgi:CheY-like chemotaxis protein
MSAPHRLVVVDDDSKVRLLLERAFRPPEFEAYAFPNGAAALARLPEIRPDCVVSDVLMPDMDGETLLRAVRAVPGLERVPFIALSAVRSEARIRAVLAAGADAFLVKPFPLRDLIDKVRALLERPATSRSGPERTGDYTSPTRPVVAMTHTTSTAAVRRRSAPARFAPPPEPPPPPVAEPPPDFATAPAVRVAPVRVVARAEGPAEAVAGRRFEIGPPDLGFGRFTRVEVRDRSFVVLTEAVAEPRFTVTTVITEKGVPLRKVESALPHPLAREEDRATVRLQIALQHEDALRRIDDLVLDHTRRRVVWSDQSRSVDAGVLAWAMSAVAQMAEQEVGADEAARQLRLTRESGLVGEQSLRAFFLTPLGRVAAGDAPRLPRRAVRAVAAWCRAFADATLQAPPEAVVERVRQATRRYSLELERMGFYERLGGAART